MKESGGKEGKKIDSEQDEKTSGKESEYERRRMDGHTQ